MLVRMAIMLGASGALAGCAAVAVVDTAVDAAATTAGAAVDVTAGAVDAAVPDEDEDD